MSRRRYLLAYDISDDRRLRQVHRCAKTYGYALQYSVFICDLDAVELTNLRWDLGAIIAHNIDRVAIIDIGASNSETRFQFMGVAPALPRSGPTII
ncbi:MAG: CRISPR-associated endonuclease Cas2 [Euzebya sp.]